MKPLWNMFIETYKPWFCIVNFFTSSIAQWSYFALFLVFLLCCQLLMRSGLTTILNIDCISHSLLMFCCGLQQPVFVRPTQQQSVRPTSQDVPSYIGHIIFSCLVIWFCNCPFGVIAFILAGTLLTMRWVCRSNLCLGKTICEVLLEVHFLEVKCYFVISYV